LSSVVKKLRGTLKVDIAETEKVESRRRA
jgi:hypothetical protein